MTEQEKKESLAALALHLNDMIDIATRAYDLSATLIRNDEGDRFLKRHFPDLRKMVEQISSQNEFVQKIIQSLAIRVNKEGVKNDRPR